MNWMDSCLFLFFFFHFFFISFSPYISSWRPGGRPSWQLPLESRCLAGSPFHRLRAAARRRSHSRSVDSPPHSPPSLIRPRRSHTRPKARCCPCRKAPIQCAGFWLRSKRRQPARRQRRQVSAASCRDLGETVTHRRRMKRFVVHSAAKVSSARSSNERTQAWEWMNSTKSSDANCGPPRASTPRYQPPPATRPKAGEMRRVIRDGVRRARRQPGWLWFTVPDLQRFFFFLHFFFSSLEKSNISFQIKKHFFWPFGDMNEPGFRGFRLANRYQSDQPDQLTVQLRRTHTRSSVDLQAVQCTVHMHNLLIKHRIFDVPWSASDHRVFCPRVAWPSPSANSPSRILSHTGRSHSRSTSHSKVRVWSKRASFEVDKTDWCPDRSLAAQWRVCIQLSKQWTCRFDQDVRWCATRAGKWAFVLSLQGEKLAGEWWCSVCAFFPTRAPNR